MALLRHVYLPKTGEQRHNFQFEPVLPLHSISLYVINLVDDDSNILSAIPGVPLVFT